MRLSDVLWNLVRDKGCVSITGSGGKTSLLCLLARRIQDEGHSVLVTTTTKLASPSKYPYPVGKVFLDEAILSYRPRKGEGVFYARSFQEGKVCSPDLGQFPLLRSMFEYVLVEADGSRQLPLKYHTQRDPVVLEGSYPIAVMGLSALGRPVREVCHGLDREGVVDVPFLQWLIDQKEGALKGGARLLLLNQAEQINLPLPLSVPVPTLYASVRSDSLLMQV